MVVNRVVVSPLWSAPILQGSADLGSWHGREGVGGSENGLVVHHGLGCHHWYSAHLTHLGRDLAEDKRGREGWLTVACVVETLGVQTFVTFSDVIRVNCILLSSYEF